MDTFEAAKVTGKKFISGFLSLTWQAFAYKIDVRMFSRIFAIFMNTESQKIL